MSITLSPKLAAIVQEQVESGSYDDAENVLEEALQLLVERDELRRMRAWVDEGTAEYERGETERWTPELKARLIREGDELYRQRAKPDPDVWP
jgi:antitoxin ParD1/3/4